MLVAAALSGTAYGAAAGGASALGLPITFERNDGQYPASVTFASRGLAGTLELRGGELAIVPRRAGERARDPVRIHLLGANPAPEIEPASPLATRSHYYLGNDASRRVLGVPHYAELRMKDVYPGIDLALHGREGALEYDFVVAPGADPRDIRIDLRGTDRAEIDAAGNLRMERDGQFLVQQAPITYQGSGHDRHDVPSHFRIVDGPDGREARIALGSYDPSAPLVVDPTLAYSSYVGSSGSDAGTLLAVDAAGNMYYAQQYGIGASGATDTVVVTCLNPTSNTITYQTAFGGNGTSAPTALALGGSGGQDVYVTGYTNASNFPSSVLKADSSFDAFLTVLHADGSIAGSRVFGASGTDIATSIALGGSGNAYIGGYTNSPSLATTGPALNLGTTSLSDGFVADIGPPPTLTTIAARYVGGSGDDRVNGVAFDTYNHVVAVGETHSPDLPFFGPGTQTSPAPSGGTRGFVATFTYDLSGVQSQRYVGGQSLRANAVAIDPLGDTIVIAGDIDNANVYPASSRPYAGGVDTFVVRMGASGSDLTFGTLIGGSADDHVAAIALSGQGDVYLTGYTLSPDFPLAAPLTQGAVRQGSRDAFVARLRANALDFSTYLGGSGNESGTSIVAPGPEGVVYVGGYTSSVDLPVVNPYRAARSGADDGFVARIIAPDRRPEFERDFDGDYDGDIVWQNVDGTVSVWLMNGTTMVGHGPLAPAGSGKVPLLFPDLNGDGKTDILWQNSDGSIDGQLMQGLASLGTMNLMPAGTGWVPIKVADFNGDGMSDILWQNSDGSVGLWLMNSLSRMANASLMGPGTGWSVKAVGDFDGDGMADILWTHTDGSVGLWLMNGTTVKSHASLMGPGTGWSVTAVADLDGDGRKDIVWTHTDGSVGVWLMNGLTVKARAPLMPAGTGWRVTAAGDFNGDRRSDLVWTNTDGSVGLWLMDGLTRIANTSLMPAGTGWSVALLTDANGDGKADIVWRHTSGSVGLWLMDGLTRTANASLQPSGSTWTPK